jgi:hypothetical protein
MKKLVAVLLVFFIVMGSVSLMAQAKPRLTVDLKTLPLIKNEAAFTKNYDDLLIKFPAWPAGTDFTAFDRIIVKVKYFNANGVEMPQNDTRAMVTLIYDVNGDLRGPDMGPGPNTPLKVLNVGGYSSSISGAGSAMKLAKAPEAILFQNSSVDVKFIEVEEITFFKR